MQTWGESILGREKITPAKVPHNSGGNFNMMKLGGYVHVKKER